MRPAGRRLRGTGGRWIRQGVVLPIEAYDDVGVVLRDGEPRGGAVSRVRPLAVLGGQPLCR
ncbi:hypothetical protein AB0H97_06140 [Streptomyces sp. NPDC050788]|uniref:hypothetical protein n=1 Tax=Streptomyces sp. NPDC050788 TaxID=3155041 RepID=UPI003419AED6